MVKSESHIPKVRFDGFSDEWKKIQFKDIAKLSQGLQIAIDQRFLEPASDREFYITNEFLNPNSTKKYYIENPPVNVIASPKDILMTRTGNTGKVVTNVKGAFHNNFFKIKYDENITSKLYLYYILTSPNIQNEMIVRAGTSTIPDLNHSDFYSIKCFFSDDIQEQTQIGNFFQKIDQVIELQQKALDIARNYKKSMLQKMFPQKGEKVPQIRFDGFSGDWEETLLGKIATINRGLTYKPENIVNEGQGIRVLRSSNINEDVLVLGADDVFVDAQAVKLENICVGDILITAANGSSRLVGKHAVVKDQLDNTVHGGFMLTARTEVPFFINSWMNTIEYKLMLQLVQGGNGAIGNLSKPTLEQCKMHIPKTEEQQKIGEFFQKLDQQIEQHEKKLESYQNLKKAMLQRMFV